MPPTTISSLHGPSTPGIFNLLAYAFAPSRFALRNAESFGRVYRVRGPGGALLVTSHPEHVKRIFAADSDAFETYSQFTLGGVLGKQSVLVTAGPTHRRQRKLLSPPLTGARLRAFGATMQEIADRHVSALRPGREFRALELCTDFTLDVIVQTVFGVTDGAEGASLRDNLRVMVHEVPALAVFMPRLQRSWFRPWARYVRASERFDAWLRGKLAEPSAQALVDDERDVLSLLRQSRADDGTPMEQAELRDQLVTLLLAGHETTSIALASCLERIHRHPDVLAQVRAEIAAAPSGPADVQHLPYLSAVIDETLRIAPVLSDVTRRARSEFWLDEQLRLNPGEGVLVLIEALHRDPELYAEPARFRPERFLERKFTHYEFVPFGGGVRRCLGAAFSDYETKILLATLLRRVDLRLLRDRPDERVRRNVTLGPKHGVPMRVVALRS
jgi:cytochrome P450